jgi:hypothetical protein
MGNENKLPNGIRFAILGANSKIARLKAARTEKRLAPPTISEKCNARIYLYFPGIWRLAQL